MEGIAPTAANSASGEAPTSSEKGAIGEATSPVPRRCDTEGIQRILTDLGITPSNGQPY